MSIDISVNMEFVRHDDKSFEEGVRMAAELGYKYVEPMVHNGREVMSEGGYYHTFSMDDDPLEMKEILDKYGMKASSLSGHGPLMRPEISVPQLEKAVRFAAAIGVNIVNTDEGIRPRWLSDEDCFHVMRYTLTKVLQIAERHQVYIAIEPHQSITKTTQGLLKVATLVDSPNLRVNYDTGNSFLSGADPYAGLQAVLPLLVHIHAKDIPRQQATAERGKVTGTPVGCACGEGVIDWARVIGILRAANWSGTLSVECGTPQQAADSLRHLSAVIQSQAGAAGA